MAEPRRVLGAALARASAFVVATSFALAPALAPPLAAQQPQGGPDAALTAPLPVDSAVRTGTLSNGVRYWIRVNRRPEDRAELRLAVNAGSILETPEQRGLAHFVEHMAFNGTEHFAKNELVSYLESIGMRFGADLNAYTSFDETVYQLTIPTDTPAVMEKGFQILEDWAHGQTFDSAQVASERGVVMEEWRLGQGAGSRLRQKQFPVLFSGSRYAERLPIGDTAVIEGATPAKLKAFYATWYRPGLMNVVAVGDFDPDRVESLIREHFGRIPAHRGAPARPSFPVPPNDTALVSIATDPEATGTGVTVYYKHPVRQDSTVGDYRRDIVEGLYDRMMNQRLYELTQQADPPFIGAYAGESSMVRTADAYVLGAAVPAGGVMQGLDALLTEGERVYRHGFTPSELERAKAESLRAMERAWSERDKTESQQLVDEYVRAALQGEPIPGIAREYDYYRRFVPGISLAEVNGLAKRWMSAEGRVVLVQGPDGSEMPSKATILAAFDSVRQRDVAAYDDGVANAPLVPNPPTPGRIVKTERIDTLGATVWTLSNGVRVVLKPTDFKDDQVLFRAFSPGGSSLSPDSDFIAATTASAVVDAGGVGDFSAVDLQKKLAGKAASVTPYISTLEEGLSGGGSPKDLDTLFPLIWLYFTQPRADTTAFASFQSRLQAAVANRSNSPDAAFQDTIQVVLASHSPRAEPLSSDWFGRMDLDRSVEIYRDRFADAGDFTFVFVGSFSPDSIRPLVEKWIGSLPATGREETWGDPGIEAPPGVVTRTLHRGLEPKAETRIVFHGPFDATDDALFDLDALADVLRIRLRDVLREEMSGTYGVNVGTEAVRHPRPTYQVAIDFSAAPDRIQSLTDAVFQQIDSLRSAGPTAAELAKVKETDLRERETSMRQNAYWLGALTGIFRDDREPSFLWDFERRVKGLSAGDVSAAVERYLDTGRYVRVTRLPEETPGGGQ